MLFVAAQEAVALAAQETAVQAAREEVLRQQAETRKLLAGTKLPITIVFNLPNIALYFMRCTTLSLFYRKP